LQGGQTIEARKGEDVREETMTADEQLAAIARAIHARGEAKDFYAAYALAFERNKDLAAECVTRGQSGRAVVPRVGAAREEAVAAGSAHRPKAGRALQTLRERARAMVANGQAPDFWTAYARAHDADPELARAAREEDSTPPAA
jgi:hypothetical protein